MNRDTRPEVIAQLERYAEGLEARKRELEEELSRIQAELAQVTEMFARARGTLADLHKYFGITTPARHEPTVAGASVTVRNALIALAREKGGVLDASEAARRLIEIGRFRDMRHAGANIYPFLSRNRDLFQKVGPGRYVLRATHETVENLPLPEDDSPAATLAVSDELQA